jgi:hypothetical protein
MKQTGVDKSKIANKREVAGKERALRDLELKVKEI